MKYLFFLIALTLTACKKQPEPEALSPSLSEAGLVDLAQKSLTAFSPGYYEHIESARWSDDQKKVLIVFKKPILDQKECVLLYDGFRRYQGSVISGNSSVGPITIDLDAR